MDLLKTSVGHRPPTASTVPNMAPEARIACAWKPMVTITLGSTTSPTRSSLTWSNAFRLIGRPEYAAFHPPFPLWFPITARKWWTCQCCRQTTSSTIGGRSSTFLSPCHSDLHTMRCQSRSLLAHKTLLLGPTETFLNVNTWHLTLRVKGNRNSAMAH